jgi:hypothetical protein
LQDIPVELGVYYKDDRGWVRLDTARCENNMKRGFLTRVTGIGWIKFMLKCRGASRVELTEAQPVFYIRTSTPVSQADLIRLESKKDHREVQLQSFNTTEFKGLKGENIFETGIRRLGEDLFAARSMENVPSGEYLLSFDGGYSGYDFRVR